LAYARESAVRAGHVSLIEKALIVALPETLQVPYVKTEVEDLIKLLAKASIDTTVMQNPRRTELLLELPKHAIVHFACHGYSADGPSQSFLLGSHIFEYRVCKVFVFVLFITVYAKSTTPAKYTPHDCVVIVGVRGFY
jgi:CHAT domain